MSYTFLAKVVDGDWDGQSGLGSFSYDLGDLLGTGYEFLYPTQLATQLTIFAQTFSETDDSAYPGAPLVLFLDGNPVELSWYIEPPTVINEPGVVAIYVEGPLIAPPPQSGHDFNVQARVVGTMVPEPSSIAFSAVAGLGLGIFLIRRRRAARTA